MQIKKKLIEEKGSMAVYTMVTLLSFLTVLTGIYLSSTSVRKTQLKTVMRIKQSYEIYNANAEDVYQIQLQKLNKQESNAKIVSETQLPSNEINNNTNNNVNMANGNVTNN